MRNLIITAILAVLTSQIASAEVVYEMFMALEPDTTVFKGSFTGGQKGASLAKGDFDGDGIEDIAMGSPFASTDDKKWNGVVDMYLEKGNKKLSFSGKNSGDQLGSKLVFGDFNNDGNDDIAIGAYNAYKSNDRPGEVYIYYGHGDWNSQADNLLDTQTLNITYVKPDLTLSGYETNDSFGLDVYSADINNDVIDDLIIGIPFASTPSYSNSGKVNVYYGHKRGLKKEISLTIRGNESGERFGSSIASGDIDGDGQENLIVGAYYGGVDNTRQIGKVYIYDDFSPNDYVIRNYQHVLKGKNEKEWFGFDVDTGKFNDDDIDDIAISSFPYSGNSEDSKVSLFFGTEEEMKGSPDEIFTNFESESMQGASVMMEDFDMDGKDDVVVGAPGVGDKTQSTPGNINIYYANGKKSLIVGKDTDDWFGSSILTIDFDQDGYKDLVIGARYADGEKSMNNGEVYVIRGNGIGFGTGRIVSTENYVRRDEFISTVLQRLSLKTQHEKDLEECAKFIDFCLFNFSAMSDYDEMKLDGEIQLYPDVGPNDRLYNDINIATMLGMINGYLNEKNSPFHPERPISRIQSLKVVLGALKLVDNKFRFELVDELGSVENLKNQKSYFKDVNPKIADMWWYPRYTNFAVENGIINNGDLFRPDDNITMAELDDLIDEALAYIKRINEEANLRRNTEDETFGIGSKNEG